MVMTSDEAVSTQIGGILSRQPAVGLFLGVVHGGELAHFQGHGVADPVTGAPITPDTVFRIASITKTLTAVAVMQLVEQGHLDLDRPAGDFLRAYRLVPGRPGLRPPTIRHLLTHTAGLGEVTRARDALAKDFGESFPVGGPLPSLAEFYGGELRYHAHPGTRFVYNNHGPATLGQIVEDVTGTALAVYVRAHIFEPLGMTCSTLTRADLAPRLTPRLAIGHELRSRRVDRIPELDWVTVGAAAAWSTPRDIARFLAALLAGGCAPDGTRILRAETVAAMVAQYSPDPRIPGMGLGFFRSLVEGRAVAGHQGTLPGFHSAVAFAPDAGVGALAFTNGASQPDLWLPAAVHHLLGTMMGPSDTLTRPASHHPELWADHRGWYRLDARSSDIRLRGMLGAGAEVFIRGGRLMLRFLTPVPALALGFPLVPDDAADPHAFRIDLPGEDAEPIRVVFGQGPSGVTDRLCCDIMPLVLWRNGRNSDGKP